MLAYQERYDGKWSFNGCEIFLLRVAEMGKRGQEMFEVVGFEYFLMFVLE